MPVPCPSPPPILFKLSIWSKSRLTVPGFDALGLVTVLVWLASGPGWIASKVVTPSIWFIGSPVSSPGINAGIGPSWLLILVEGTSPGVILSKPISDWYNLKPESS